MNAVHARRRPSTRVSPGSVDLRAPVGQVVLANPVMTASGTSGHGAELSAYFDLAKLGAVVVKSVSVSPWGGNPAPRMHPLADGLLNSVGLQNPGVTAWLETDLPPLAACGAVVVASIWGFSASEYERAAGAIHDSRTGGKAGAASLAAVEVNISCPNVEDRRRMFAHSVEGVREAVTAAASGLAGCLPLWAKLSPNVTDLPDLASTAVESGAAAVTLINTVMGLAVDPATGVARLGGGGGGLSGPAIHPVAVRAVYECRAALPEVPIVGVGGITRGEDAAELLAAGADAVQVGTASFADPRAPIRVLSELEAWCVQHGVSHLEELKGRAHERR
jgi:dihydroorotate dehydrogenase (NAD+) catalytic subunit